MTRRMLIDASHPEETRVVVLNDQQLEEFDFESTTKKQLKGNIYLAKVTRVEPSLQAAFVDYGGNRHGFLAFSEIHPDYYQIPQADRRVLEEANSAAAAEAAEGNGAADERDGEGQGETEAVATDPDEETAEVFDEQAKRRSQLLRSYKIQEVIKRRQILLVQVVKEERGNKGAALTTYLSLAGRYCVLMPNTARGGGISRKIANSADRARLKSIARELNVPEGMGLIIRTAGQQRNKQEIKRDYEYLLRLWSDIRDLTLKSIAPCTIHEEGALVQRAIRDLYTRDVDEVLVDGEEGYRTARKIMGMLMPSHARRVKLYKDDVPLFYRYHVEDRLDAMHNPVGQLKSGGSIVIHTTEALTAIDVNSGRSTRERNIEETALKTNLEATEEIARQLRLRDVAGLVVVDFIDMNEPRNQRATERRMREALKSDRARVQLGKISPFGLLELSRQRLRPSFLELSTQPCPTCHGVGAIRSTESAALQALRAIELEGIRGKAASIGVTLPLQTALYLLNHKRNRLADLERRYGMAIEIRVGEELIAGDFEIEHKETKPEVEAEARPAVAAPADARTEPAPAAEDEGEGEGEGAGKKRRRRRRRRRRPQDGETQPTAVAAAGDGEAQPAAEPPAQPEPVAEPETADAAMAASPAAGEEPAQAEAEVAAEPAEPRVGETAEEGEVKDKKPRRRRPRTAKPKAEGRTRTAKPKAEGRSRRKKVAAEPGAQPNGAEQPEAAHAGPAEDTASARTEEPEAQPAEPAPEAAGAPPERPEPEARPGGRPGGAETGGEPAGEAAEEHGTEDAERSEVPAAAVVNRRGGGSGARRGWWSRFVRKDE